jgi:hypothetical protein
MTYMQKKDKEKFEKTFSSQAITEPDETTCG